MDIDQAQRIWRSIEKTSRAELLGELLKAATTYARMRTDYRLTEVGSRGELEQSRTVSHNRLIDACNILSRAMLAAGESNSWRAELSDDRKVIGDFACHLHCILGLEAR